MNTNTNTKELNLNEMEMVSGGGWKSMLPLLSVGISSIGYWTNNAQKIRLSQLFATPCTLVYDAMIHSWGGTLNETITLISIIVSVCRFGWSNLAKTEA